MAPSFEASARFWSRAYPRRWRAARGEELVGLLADLGGPGARRLGARSALDVVRHGWATRLRDRPPLLAWAAYRFLDRPLPAYDAWVRDDVTGRFFGVRLWLVCMACFLLGLAGLDLAAGDAVSIDPVELACMALGMFAGHLTQAGRWRRRTLRRQAAAVARLQWQDAHRVEPDVPGPGASVR